MEIGMDCVSAGVGRLSCLTLGDSVFGAESCVDAVSGFGLAASSLFALGSFLDLVTFDLVPLVLFRRWGSSPSMAERKREYLIRAACPFVISCAKIGS